MNTKQCAACGEHKETSAFYTQHGRPMSYCKPCHNAKSDAWSKASPTSRIASRKAWRKANPDRLKRMKDAGNRLHHAIRMGRIVRGVVCEHCGAGCRIEAAHFDYDKPLEVKWLCVSCHRKWDMQHPKS